MPDVNIQLEPFEEDDLRHLLDMSIEAARLAILYTAQEVWGNIRRFAPVDHGRLAGSFQLDRIDDFAYRIHSAVQYALFVHEGTGVYGETGQPIRPVTAQALKFYWKRIGQTVVFKGDLAPHEFASFANWAEERGMRPFFTWPKGMEGRPFADEAIEAAQGRTDEFIARAMRETVG